MNDSVGTHFDSWVFEAFTSALPEILEIYNRYKEV